MWKGRDMVICSVAFLAGDYFGGWLTFPPESYIVAAAFAALATAVYSATAPAYGHSRLIRHALLLLALFLLGATATQVGRMPPSVGKSELQSRCVEMKAKVSEHLGTIIDNGDELAVLKALAIGDKSELPRALKNDYKRSGAMHLLALSGLHVGIIYKLLGGLLIFLGGEQWLRRLRSMLIVLMLWVFAMVSGMSPSIARAVLMITIYEMAPLMGSRRDGLTALSTAAVIITIVNPEAPRQISFQLSFAACVAIFTIFPRMRQLLFTNSRMLRYIWDCLSLAISCQLVTGPISYVYFGTFPRFFMVTNLLTVPLVAVIMYLMAAAMLTSGLPYIGPATAFLLQKSVHLLNYLVATISTLPDWR